MKIKDTEYEEISEKEYWKLPNDEGADFGDAYTGKTYYFKKAQKFPIVFEDEWYRFEVYEDIIKIIAKNTGSIFELGYNTAFPLLVKAVEKAKEIMKNEKRK